MPEPSVFKAPWFTNFGDGTSVLCGDPDDPEIICQCNGDDPMLVINRPGGSLRTAQDIARLIATVPELLVTLKAGVKAANKIDHAKNLPGKIDAERKILAWANQARITIARTR